jgi:hypothetical protein
VYRWLRRLITLNNDYVMSQTQFERERAFPDAAVRPEPASYSKCHRFSGQVFSCGTMNTTKFSDIRLQQHQMKKLLGCLDEDPLQPFTEPPPMDLNINIEIQCPLQLAPNEYLEKCKLNNFESDIIKPALLKGSQSPFFFKMDVCGPSWNELSLPSSVELEISSSNFRNDKNLCVNTNEECVCKSV